jgi:D-arabinose 1-dehydrogenase-like Zn-dependent alcohol dehydrogenase
MKPRPLASLHCASEASSRPIAPAAKATSVSALVLAGTGPVGMRSAALLAKEGASVTLAGRQLAKAQEAAKAIEPSGGWAL